MTQTSNQMKTGKLEPKWISYNLCDCLECNCVWKIMCNCECCKCQA